MSPEKMIKTLFAPAGANSARLFDRLKYPEGSSSGYLVYIITLQPLSPPACNPETKYFWQRMNTMSTGTRLATDMANT